MNKREIFKKKLIGQVQEIQLHFLGPAPHGLCFCQRFLVDDHEFLNCNWQYTHVQEHVYLNIMECHNVFLTWRSVCLLQSCNWILSQLHSRRPKSWNIEKYRRIARIMLLLHIIAQVYASFQTLTLFSSVLCTFQNLNVLFVNSCMCTNKNSLRK